MAQIRSQDTQPEKLVRSLLHDLGYRFTISSQKNKKLLGKPDIILPKYQLVIFVNGCFWHAHENCRYFKVPATRRDWWEAKLLGNRNRDLRNHEGLLELGWRVFVIWECSMKRSQDIPELSSKINQAIRGKIKYVEIEA